MEKSNQKGVQNKSVQQNQSKLQKMDNISLRKNEQVTVKANEKNFDKQIKSKSQKIESKGKGSQERFDKKIEEQKIELIQASCSHEEQKFDLSSSHNQQKSVENQQYYQKESNDFEEKITCEQCGQQVSLLELDDHLTAHELQERPPTGRGQREIFNVILEHLHNVAELRSQIRGQEAGNNELQELPRLVIPAGMTESFPGGLRIIFAPSHLTQHRGESEYERLLQLDNDQFDRGKGLSEKQISKIKKQKISKKIAQELGSCCVCLADFKENDLCRNLQCQHIFHMVCIDEWLSRKTYCPICKNKEII